MSHYSPSSPYFTTGEDGNFLSIMNHRAIPKEPDDIVYVIKPQHALRPDLLAYDLYKNAGLWWVFAARNPNTIEDPIFDFQEGVTIYLPKMITLQKSLGV